jgi:hypothetical protein
VVDISDDFGGGEEVTSLLAQCEMPGTSLARLMTSSGGEHFNVAPTRAPKSAPKVTSARLSGRYCRSAYVPGDEERLMRFDIASMCVDTLV